MRRIRWEIWADEGKFRCVKLAIAIIIAIVKRMPNIAFYIVTYCFIYHDPNRSAHDKTTFERTTFYVFIRITSLFSKWAWPFKETFNEKIPRIPHASHVLDFSIPSTRPEDVY